MTRYAICSALAAALLSALLLHVFTASAQEDDVEQLRAAAAAAMQDLRYRDALSALERIENAGQATFEDKDNILVCLLKLRENAQFGSRLEQYMQAEENLLNKGQFSWRLIRHLQSENRWNNRGRLRTLYRQTMDWMRQGAADAEGRATLADFAFAYIDFLLWDDRYNNSVKVVELARGVTELAAGDERSARALLVIAQQYERFDRQHRKSFEQVNDAYRAVVSSFPATDSAANAQYRIASRFQGASRFLQALAEFALVIENWPEHSLAQAAQEQIDEIKKPRLQVYVPEVFQPGKTVTINVRYRNVTAIDFAAFRFDLLEKMAEVKTFDLLSRHFDASAGEPEAAWQYGTEDKGEHQWHSTSIEVPLSAAGAFLLQSTGLGVSNRSLLLISGLATVVKNSNREVTLFCADAETGEPVGGADLLLLSGSRREEVRLPGEEEERRIWRFQRSAQGRTDDGGIWSGQIDEVEDYDNLLLIARRGQDFAVSNSYLYWWHRGAEDGMRAYIYTDRPVYRPSQEVNFKAILRTVQDGVLANRPGMQLGVVITDARGNKVSEQTLTTNEFGTISGSLTLGDEPALGRWYIEIRHGEDKTYGGFAVEEYKKPEFKVDVTVPQTQYELGRRIGATIEARYYFGEPVAEAQVQYEVQQSKRWWWLRHAGNYDWLYGGDDRYGYHYYYGSRIVHQGSGTTDAEGRLQIQFDTARMTDDDRDVALYTYRVVARVTDASRREIRGSGATVVTSHEFAAGVNSDRYVYNVGDRVRLTLRTQRYDGAELATAGKLVFYRAEWNSASADYDLTKVWEDDASTDERGSGSYQFETSEQGYFLARYETADAYDNVVTGSAFIWVSGGEYRTKFFRGGDLEIVADKEHYELGDTARLLVNCRLESAWALMTVEAERVLKVQVVRLRQGANIVELPIVEAYEPNVFVKLHAVKDFALHSESAQLRVPPVEKFATITVTPSKEEFRPGERGTLLVRATDWQGKPLEAEFSIGVIDTALYYIAEDETPDIRYFFYGHQRSDSVRTASSFEFRFRGEEESKEMQAPMAARTAEANEEAAESGDGAGADDNLVEPEVRKDFKDTAIWLAHVQTGPDGTAEVDVTWPDNLTTWRATVRAVSRESVVGNARVEVVTRKNLLVRLQMPRFLVQGDEVTLSVNVHNYLDEDKRARVSVEVEGEALELVGPAERWVDVAAGAEVRVDVRARAVAAGQAQVLAKALTDEESDAMQLALPVLVHGMEKFAAAAGTVEQARLIELNLPEQIRPGSARLSLRVRPTIAGVMLDSLPYLIDYPYGCVEQTMSRFMPAAIVAKTLRDLGLERPELEDKLPKVIEAGLERLYDFQGSDGGWGWWRHDGSSVHMTAYVVYGLSLAARAGVDVDTGCIERGVRFLASRLEGLQSEDRVELLNYALFAMSWTDGAPERYLNRVYDLLPRMREYETALFAVALHNMGKAERFALVMEQLLAKADVQGELGTASWGRPYGWYWYQDNVEATALALMAQLRADPEGELVLPTVRWLLSVRKGSKWKSTRDTALAVLALTEFIKTTDEFSPDMTVSIEVDGRTVKTVRFTAENLLSDDGELVLEGDDLQPGAQRLRIVREGRGNLYYDAFLTYFSLEEHISAASTSISVERSYFKLERGVDAEGKPTLQRTPLSEGDELASGDEIEVRLALGSTNNFEYLVYEDFKPAGCEPLRLRSGYAYGSIASNLELRDEKVVFFITWLPKGEHVVTYELRAEAPGIFHALPTNGYAMYAPDVRAISDEFVMPIRDLGEEER